MFADRRAHHFVLQPSGRTESYVEVAQFRVNIQPASTEAVAMVGGIYGQTFSAFTTYSGLNINDMVTLSGTTTISGLKYRVKAIRPYNYGPLPHFEVTLTQPEI